MTVRGALLFTDVVDSTLLVERLGDAAAAQVWAEHDRRARGLLAHHHGREIDRTDGFFLLFDDVVDAARYALAYHRSLAEMALAARVGLHVGQLTLRENAPGDVARGAKPIEVEGLAKPFAARLMALAAGGQTLMSAAARAALGTVPDASAIESHGHYRLKGVEAPVEVFELGLRAGSAFAPPADTDKAYRVVRTGDLWSPVREVNHNLPAERDAFVGRAAELRELAQRLDAGARLVTVVGPGGTGKTRFVSRYARAWLGDWPGGVCFCDLSEARSLAGAFSAVAIALGVPLGKGDAATQLGHAIAGRGRCLLILDNFEQLVAHARATLGRWLDRAADARFVVTSRERLHLPGEEVLPLEPLALGDDAIELFALRAHAQRPDFVLSAANRAAVGEVVRLLDGLPLAIELAAARVRVLSPAQIVERLRDRFALLAGAHGAQARQATLRAAIDWSWELLAPWEQAALAQCSVFEGGFRLADADAVIDLTAWAGALQGIDAVQALVDKSLLRSWVQAGQGRFDLDEPYFGMYLSIHDYATEKLAASGAGRAQAAQARHGRHFAGFGSDAALDALSRHGGTRLQHALALELDNLVAACRRAVARGDAPTAVATYRAAWEVLDLQGPFALGGELGTLVLALDGIDPRSRAAACVSLALALQHLGRPDLAQARLGEALGLARQAASTRWQGTVLGHLGLLHHDQGRMDEALATFTQAIALLHQGGHRRDEGNVLGSLGGLRWEQGRIDDARTHYEAAIAIHREIGNRRNEGIVLGNLGGLHNDQGRIEQATADYQAALAILREVGNRRAQSVPLVNLGSLHMALGRFDAAQAHYDAALAIDRAIGHRYHEGVVLGHIGMLHRLQGRVDSARECYRLALAIARETDQRRLLGFVLGNLGELLAHEGRPDAARAALREGEAVLREIDARLDLAKLLTQRGQADLAGGEPDCARAALAEAQALAVELGAGPDSELGHCIDTLGKALA